MELKGNKGEWSELYAFFKLLADGVLYSGDEHLNPYLEKYYPILKIFRDSSLDRNTYQVCAAKKNILVLGKTVNIEISQSTFEEEAKKLLDYIKYDNFYNTDELYSFLNKIDVHSLKAKSNDKADIRIVIHNLYDGTKHELGYSIKSQLGAPSTLINSNKDGTNFIYKITGVSAEDVQSLNTIKKFKSKLDFLNDHNASIQFVSVASETLHSNLTMLDTSIEKIVAQELLDYYSGNGSPLHVLTKKLEELDPLNLIVFKGHPMYEYKIKQFLLAFALGMTSSVLWNGKFNANGGYIVVKDDGDIVCYHFFDRNDLEDYLFYNTRFDTPSTSRHEFGEIYEDNGEYYIKLNLQVRFLK